MIIIGAGLSGLLCGALNPGATIYEAGPNRESDHKALFRCRTEQIGKVLGIPFKKVRVHKSIWFDGEEVKPTPRIAHMYSWKVACKISSRSIFNIDSCDRYIPPEDFVDQLKIRCKIKYNKKCNWVIIAKSKTYDEPIISTIPMPSMLNMVTDFITDHIITGRKIYVNRIPIKSCDSHCTIYYPGADMNTYRASITGDTLITEGVGPLSQKELYIICDSLGINFERWMMNDVHNTEQKLGKITPIDNKFREKAITDLTLNHGIYSLGRFATWRPKVMLDDVLEDIWHIRRLIEGGNYAALNHKQSEVN